MRLKVQPSFALAVAVLCLAELATRLFFGDTMSGRFEYGYHPTAGFQEHADGMVHLVRAGGRRFYPQTFSRDRPTGTFRIMVVGDSVPRGPSLENAYGGLVGKRLRAKGIQAESINLSVPGFGARRNFLVLSKALEYQPNLVILHVNNSNEFEDERELLRAEEFRGWHPRNWLMKSLVIRRLNEIKTEKCFWSWLPVPIRIQVAVNDADAKVLTASTNPEKQKQWDERVQEYTARSIALAQKMAIPILLISQGCSERDPSGKAFMNDHGLDEMAGHMAQKGVYHLSMKKLFQPLKFQPLFSDASHMYRLGHEIMATAVVKLLQDEGVLP